MGLLYTTPALPALHPPHPSPESIISLNRPPGHVDDFVGALPYLHCGGEKGKPCTYFETLCLCHMSSARSTSDGRGPVTRKRVPDREEQGKPGNDARRGRCHPLEAGIYPCGCHCYLDTQLPSTKYQVTKQEHSGMVTHLRAFRGRKVTRQELSGMVAHQQMFRAIMDAGCRTTSPRMLCLECSACACVCAWSCAVINYLR